MSVQATAACKYSKGSCMADGNTTPPNKTPPSLALDECFCVSVIRVCRPDRADSPIPRWGNRVRQKVRHSEVDVRIREEVRLCHQKLYDSRVVGVEIGPNPCERICELWMEPAVLRRYVERRIVA